LKSGNSDKLLSKCFVIQINLIFATGCKRKPSSRRVAVVPARFNPFMRPSVLNVPDEGFDSSYWLRRRALDLPGMR
jgi:hypothetical protein